MATLENRPSGKQTLAKYILKKVQGHSPNNLEAGNIYVEVGHNLTAKNPEVVTNGVEEHVCLGNEGIGNNCKGKAIAQTGVDIDEYTSNEASLGYLAIPDILLVDLNKEDNETTHTEGEQTHLNTGNVNMNLGMSLSDSKIDHSNNSLLASPNSDGKSIQGFTKVVGK